MKVSVASRAHRALRKLPQYRTVASGDDIHASLSRQIILREGETVVGVYENSPGQLDRCVVVTSEGLHIHRGPSWQVVSYREILYVDFPGGEKTLDVDEVFVRLASGRTLCVPISGGDPSIGSRDAASFLTFLMRVAEDAHSPEDRV